MSFYLTASHFPSDTNYHPHFLFIPLTSYSLLRTENSHPRLWRLLATAALEDMDLNMAERSFVRYVRSSEMRDFLLTLYFFLPSACSNHSLSLSHTHRHSITQTHTNRHTHFLFLSLSPSHPFSFSLTSDVRITMAFA